MSINRNFGYAVRTIRIEKGWSQERFAEIAEIHRTYVSSIERGKVSVSLAIAEKLADAFNMPLSEVIEIAEKSS